MSVGPQELHTSLAFARFNFVIPTGLGLAGGDIPGRQTQDMQGLVELGRLTCIHFLPWEG